MKKSAVKWEVHYAKFFNFPEFSDASDSSLRRPLPAGKRRRLKGTWVSSSSNNVVLEIFNDHISQPRIVVSLLNNIYEEHYISMLNFVWPQGVCLESLDERSITGSRVLFACYRDRTGQIQKFAMRFSSSEKCQEFTEVLKCLKDASQDNFSRAMQSSTNHGQSLVPYSRSQQAALGQAPESTDVPLPESFTSLLAGCFTAAEPGANQEPAEIDLKCFLKAGSEADKPFVDMLEKLDNIIVGLRGDLRF